MTLVVAFAAILATTAAILLGPGDEPHAVTAAFQRPDPQWPPPHTEAALDTELASTEAMRALLESSIPDQGPPPPDQGPLLHVGADHPEVLVREGLDARFPYYEVVLGEGIGFDDPMPMALLIHGRGDRARLPGGPFLGLSQPLRVIVPQAPDALGAGFEWLPVRVGSGLIDRLTTSLIGRAAELAAMIRGLAETRPTIGRAIVVGFSQGGLLTFTLATHFSDVVGAAFPLAAWLPPALVPPYRRDDIRYPRISGLHGEADRVIPLAPTEAVYTDLAERGFAVRLETFADVGHEMSDDMNTRMHEWLEEAVAGAMDSGVESGMVDAGVPLPPCGDGGALGGCVETPDAGPPDAGIDAGADD